MKNKKLSVILLMVILLILCSAIIPNIVNASTNIELYLGILEYRTGTDPENMGYAILNPEADAETGTKGMKIWDIVKYSSETDNVADTTPNYYCVKAGVGFSDEKKRGIYNRAYDFRTEKEAILGSGNSTLVSITNNDNYYNLLALTDLLYLKGLSTDEEKAALKTVAGVGITEYGFKYDLTDSDIEAIQQAAIWYFTNGTESKDVYDNTERTNWLFYRTEEMEKAGDSYTTLADYEKNAEMASYGEGYQRNEQANLLYNYLIDTAKNNASKYKNGTANPKTKITLYINATDTESQPVILIEKEKEKIFDLALRKYITKVDGTEVKNTRVPEITTSTIDTEGTATYNHRKDPVVVENGSVVTYNIAIYNEGEKAGYATTIVDDLPSGLILSDSYKGKTITSSKGNKYKITYDETNNKITFTLDKTSTINELKAYETALDQDVIEFTCNVTAKPDTQKDKILTNIAWIAEEYDAIEGLTITNEVGKDRDSEPALSPTTSETEKTTYKGNTLNKQDLTDSKYFYQGQQDDDDFEKLLIEKKTFDLKLIKRITEVNSIKVEERIESIDISKLADGTKTTADYKLNKNPVAVKTGDIVKYTFRIYNEGEIDGYASEITEDIPDGLEFLWSELTEEELDASTEYTDEEKQAIKYNNSMYWTFTKDLKTITTDYLAKGKGLELTREGANLIKAFNPLEEYVNNVNSKNPDYKEVSVYLKVTSTDFKGTIIRNEAAITANTDSEGNNIDDRDSDTEKWVKYEDDEDYDNIILKQFDLSLRKFIIAVSNDKTIEDKDYLKNANGTYIRSPQVDTSKLNTIDSEGKTITTAIYNHTKQPVEVNKGDYVVYLLRAYNECDIAGYATEITDYIPAYLEFVDGEFNNRYGWKVSKDGRSVATDYLQNSIIKEAEKTEDGYKLSYVEVPIMCRVKDTAKYKENITNIAEITISKDENKKDITDRDSTTDNVKLPVDDKLPSYKENETANYIPGQEDDDDFEKVIVKPFDLALRKFITKVNNADVTTRIPEVSYDKENDKITYNHTKEPVEVVSTDIVTYTIRVYNEGEVAGYAAEITDDLPEGLEYLPENELNKEYRWVMYDEEGKVTEDVTKAVKITTDYLSKEQGEARMKVDENLKENPALLSPFDKSKDVSETNPDYADVKVAFKVVEPNTSEKIIVNSAQISEDTDKNGNDIDDIDSTPDEWIDGEDDQDKEYIKLTYFDLALRKWVTQAIVIEDGKETVTQTGHKAEDDPEEVVKVEIHRKKINSVTVKFSYLIRITNEGDIAGYAKEITDYVPEGLKFVAEDNPGWTDEGNNVISTRLLESTLLQPGESAEVEVILTWINGNDNLGLKDNWAEISEDYNDKNVPDRDSTPDNQVKDEDDIDDAPVLLSVATGQARIYFTLGFIILITLASGIIIIKKFVL